VRQVGYLLESMIMVFISITPSLLYYI